MSDDKNGGKVVASYELHCGKTMTAQYIDMATLTEFVNAGFTGQDLLELCKKFCDLENIQEAERLARVREYIATLNESFEP